MKARMMWALGLLILMAAGSLPALAMGPVDVDAELALNSKYVWRGMRVTDDPVLQPGISGSLMGLGFGLWGNMDLTDVNEQDMEFNEIDYSLSYGMSFPFLSFEAGLIYYDFPSGGEATTELYVSAAASVLFSPHIAIYQDIDEIKGAYWELGASHGVPLSPGLDLVLDASLGLGSKGYLNGYFGVVPDLDNPGEVLSYTGASMSNVSLVVGVPYHPVPLVTITPHLGYHTLLGDAADAVDAVGGDKGSITLGVTAGFHF